MSLLLPTFNGETRIASPGPLFLEAMKARTETGLLMAKPHWRSRYVVTSHTDQELAFRAADFPTAINVGLNDVVLRIRQNHYVEYSVSYVRWAAYVVALGALLGMALIVVFLFSQDSIARYAQPVANRKLGLGLFWALVLFWAFVWPWILIMMHRPFARKLLTRIIREVDLAGGTTSRMGE